MYRELVLKRISPTKEEKENLRRIADEIIDKIKSYTDFEVKLLGSAARDTWLRYEKDLDIFIFFPKNFTKEDMEKYVEDIARKIFDSYEKKYAEHPYVRGNYKGYDIEIVPCYKISNPKEKASSVDRTPFHHEFVSRYIKGKEDDVRLLKQFLKNFNIYGAEESVRGFSGYLCELLIIKYESFENLLKNARNWKFGEIISFKYVDEKKVSEKFKGQPLIFIDPVDENRNVAAALSAENFYKFIFYSKMFFKEKDKIKFFFKERKKIDKTEAINKFKSRGTSLIGILIKRPDVVDEIVYSQSRKCLKLLRNYLERYDFKILLSEFFVSESNIMFLFELESDKLSKIKLHAGPLVNSKEEDKFLRKYSKNPYGEPFIIENRWYVFVERKYKSAEELFLNIFNKKDLKSLGIPSYIETSIKNHGFKILRNEDVFIDEFLEKIYEKLFPRIF